MTDKKKEDNEFDFADSMKGRKKEAERLRTEQNHTRIRLKHVATATAFFAELRYDICDSL